MFWCPEFQVSWHRNKFENQWIRWLFKIHPMKKVPNQSYIIHWTLRGKRKIHPVCIGEFSSNSNSMRFTSQNEMKDVNLLVPELVALQTKTSGFLGAMVLCSSNENKGIQTRNIPPMFLRHPDWFENPNQLHKAVSRSHSPSGRSVLSSHHAQNKSQNP